MKRIQVVSISVVVLCASITLEPRAFAQGGVPLWTNVIQGRATDFAAVAVDNSGNIFVAAPIAETNNGINFSDITYRIVAYSSEGLTLWSNVANGAVLAPDANANLFVAGTVFNGSNGDFSTTKYSNAGIPLWTNYYNGIANGADMPRAIAVDREGNVVVAGASGGGSNPYCLTIKYSSAGAPLWTNTYHLTGDGWETPRAVAVDSGGSVFVTGTSYGNNWEYATLKYSSTGVPVWTNRYREGAYSEVQAMALDKNGNVFVTGYSRSDGNRGLSADDYTTVAYSNSGAPLWTNRYDGPVNQVDEADAIAVDSAGNVFVTGLSVTVRDFISDTWDFATIKYSTSGVPLWTNRYDGPASKNDWPKAIAVDRGGNVFVTGSSVAYQDLSATIPDLATIAYSNAGQPIWENHYNWPDSQLSQNQAIAVDPAGNVIVTTGWYASDGFSYYTTIKYSSLLPSPVLLDFQLLNNQLVLCWTNAGFTLQSAPTLTGPFTNLPSATSPYTNPLIAPQQFFRLQGN